MQRFLLQECTDDCTLLEVLEYPSASLGLQVMPIFPMPMLSSLVSILLSPPSLSSPSFFPYTNRHIYNPLVSMGVGKLGAQIAVFLLSAAFHEVTCHVTVTWFVSRIMWLLFNSPPVSGEYSSADASTLGICCHDITGELTWQSHDKPHSQGLPSLISRPEGPPSFLTLYKVQHEPRSAMDGCMGGDHETKAFLLS